MFDRLCKLMKGESAVGAQAAQEEQIRQSRERLVRVSERELEKAVENNRRIADMLQSMLVKAREQAEHRQ